MEKICQLVPRQALKTCIYQKTQYPDLTKCDQYDCSMYIDKDKVIPKKEYKSPIVEAIRKLEGE